MIGLSAIGPGSSGTETLMLPDPVLDVRRHAVRCHRSSLRDLIAKVLADPSLELADNIEISARIGSDVRGEPAHKLRARLEPRRAAGVSIDIVGDANQPLSGRVTAIGLMSGIEACQPRTLAPSPDLLNRPERQVRLGALSALAQI
ncbi:MAG: hypothetical protein AAF409_20215 [Pseudomonadota bacterium]